MAPAARTVRRLRLRAPSEAAVRRTVRVLEDALRTATLPDAGGRILFVRRLALGRLAADVQPMSVALALEQAVARVGVEWRHGEDPGAPAAGAVWFRDPLEAHVALARRLLAGQRPEAWFWPLAVPRWTRGMTRSDGVRAIARSLAARAEAPAALPRWFAELVAAGYDGVLEATLREEDVASLSRAAGVRVEAGRGRVAPERRDVRGQPGDAPLATPQTDGVHRLIVAMLRVAGGDGARLPLSTSDSRHTPRPAASSVSQQRGGHAPAGASDAGADVGAGDGSSSRPQPPPRGDRQGGTSLTTAAEALLDERRVPQAPMARLGGAVASPSPLAASGGSPPWLAATEAGGILFLLNVLERAGYSEWIARQPEWEPHLIARRVLARVMARLAVAANDPAWDVVPVHSLPAARPRRFMAPSRWRDGLLAGQGLLLHTVAAGEGRLHDPSSRLLLAGWRGRCPRPLLRDRRAAAPAERGAGDLADEVVGAWEIAMRRWLRRIAGLGVADLALRPAAIATTLTHIDIHFDLGSADPRIRRAGLDLDPGWIPWFGRVVEFHFDRGGAS